MMAVDHVAHPLARRLLELGADLAYHDPYIADWHMDGRAVPRVLDFHDGLAVAATTVHHLLDACITQLQARALVEAGHAAILVGGWDAHEARPPAGIRPVDVPRTSGRRRLAALRAARNHGHTGSPQLDVIIVHDPELVAALAGLDQRARVWDVHEDTAAALADKPWLPPASRSLVGAAPALSGSDRWSR